MPVYLHGSLYTVFCTLNLYRTDQYVVKCGVKDANIKVRASLPSFHSLVTTCDCHLGSPTIVMNALMKRQQYTFLNCLSKKNNQTEILNSGSSVN